MALVIGIPSPFCFGVSVATVTLTTFLAFASPLGLAWDSTQAPSAETLSRCVLPSKPSSADGLRAICVKSACRKLSGTPPKISPILAFRHCSAIIPGRFGGCFSLPNFSFGRIIGGFIRLGLSPCQSRDTKSRSVEAPGSSWASIPASAQNSGVAATVLSHLSMSRSRRSSISMSSRMISGCRSDGLPVAENNGATTERIGSRFMHHIFKMVVVKA